MKFGEQLVTHVTPEWRKQYLQYEELKEFLYEQLKKLPTFDDELNTRQR